MHNMDNQLGEGADGLGILGFFLNGRSWSGGSEVQWSDLLSSLSHSSVVFCWYLSYLWPKSKWLTLPALIIQESLQHTR